MADETRKHWTDDEDLLARFVLGKLDAGEASSLQQHLEECARCAEAVRAERVIAAGLKRAGREELKQRLAHRLGQRSWQFNWYQAAGIAAAVVLLVTVAIRDDWFIGSVNDQAKDRQESDSLMLSKQETPAPQTAPERPSADAVRSKTSGREADSIAAAAAEGRHDGVGEKRTLSLHDVKKSQPLPTTLGKEVPAHADQAQPALMAVAADTKELWAQGTLIRADVVTRFEDRAANVAAEVKGISVAAKAKEVGIDSLYVSITQLPLKMLPVGRQRPGRTDEVQTSFRQGPQGLTVTLFNASEALLSPNELAQARLELIGSDSLVLIAGQKRIAYKTPPGWLRTQIPSRAR